MDGNNYTDYWVGHGALILGHAPDTVIEAVKAQLPYGTHFGFTHEKEVELAEKIVKHVPSAEMVRYASSGTEANMYGTRLARAYTGRNKMLKIEGGWHGGYDSLHSHVSRPYGGSESAGLNPKTIEDTYAVPYNDLGAAKGTNLLGIKAVIAESFERIHRNNLVGMGALPLVFKSGENIDSLGLDGTEIYSIEGLADITPGKALKVTVEKQDGNKFNFEVIARLDTEVDVTYFRHGGILPYVLRQMMKE